MLKHIFRLVLSPAVFAVLLLSGCGGGTATSANGGSITINPTTIAWTNSGITSTSTCTGGGYTYTVFTIAVFNANNIPVANAGLHVSLDLASATSSGTGVMTLYDDPTWVSGSSTPPTNAVGGSYSTSTGGDGTKTLIVRMDQTCAYKGYLSVSSGALFQQATLSVTAG